MAMMGEMLAAFASLMAYAPTAPEPPQMTRGLEEPLRAGFQGVGSSRSRKRPIAAVIAARGIVEASTGVLVRRGLGRGSVGTLEGGFGGEVEGKVVVEDAVLAEGAV